MSKTCGRCHEEKKFKEFGKRSKSKDGHQSYCKSCVRAYDRERYETTDRPQQVRALANQRKQELRALAASYLAAGCRDCGNSDYRVLQFDHRDPETKTANVSTMIRTGVSWDKIEAEILKCDVRCANCHAIRTAEQFGWWSHKIAMIEQGVSSFITATIRL